ncbi:P-loop containing nucleoside triphosphate hydrolase protein [Diplogelasinospora grovesii]|uniref:P-loop containing nucleoside triphosphate hydrolase protein n=1 Tax=Diplogelasinospora grovesii TaxID=303347 RepID=A0AAN6N9V6_9PEZI|nr:P-loop containing nucleoside triphosphate hydrolase protein [Diplogelasinospora grovesii]
MFVHHGPKNVQISFRQIPQNEFENLNLRAKSSVSSFAETSSYSPVTKVLTPQTGSSEVAAQTHAPLPQEAESHFEPALAESVKLPFSHTGSITRNPRFYGRSEVLDEIDYAFGLKHRSGSAESQTFNHKGSPDTPKTYVLCGMGGIGKTETASEYLYSRRDHFDAVIWIYADTTRKLGAQFVTLAKELSKDTVSDSMDEVSAREVVKGWLGAPVGYRTERGRSVKVEATWLMVFDNADHPDVLYDWLPGQGPGCILVTGRYPYVKENAYRLERGLDLEVFSPEVGGDMLRKLSGREQEAAAMDASIRISEALGGLPLAIFQMSAIIRQNHLTFKDFEDWYREDAKGLKKSSYLTTQCESIFISTHVLNSSMHP